MREQVTANDLRRVGQMREWRSKVGNDATASVRVTVAAILYTLAVALGVLGTMESDVRLLFWSLIVTKPAALITTYVMVQSDRLNLERLLDNLVERARQRKRAEVTRIH